MNEFWTCLANEYSSYSNKKQRCLNQSCLGNLDFCISELGRDYIHISSTDVYSTINTCSPAI